MLAVEHARAVALLTALCAGMPASAQTDARAVTLSGGGDARVGRIDRTVVSPFRGNRRIVVEPGKDGGSIVVPVGAAFKAPAPAAPAFAAPVTGISVPAPLPAATASLPAAGFIDIGPLDAAPAPLQPVPQQPAGVIGTPCGADCPSQQVEFLDIQPFYGTAPPPSSFPPD